MLSDDVKLKEAGFIWWWNVKGTITVCDVLLKEASVDVKLIEINVVWWCHVKESMCFLAVSG